MKKLTLTLALVVINALALLASGPSGTLPVIYINIDNNAEVTSKETYLKAQYWLDPKGTADIEAIGSESSPLKLQIKGRGNYTFTGFDKKPYRLKLEKKQPLYGLESSKHFGLLAHADDTRGFLRNTIGFEISKGLGLPWTPEQRPIEVVINGSYRGLYFLVELIRIDKKRVNITSWEEEDAEGNPLSKWIEGGTLVEIDNYDEEAQIRFTDGDGELMRVTYDKSVDPGYEPDGYCDWLRNQFTTINNLVFGDKNSDELWRYIDLDDCARFMLVQEICNNYESFHGSCYMHREKGENEKWHFSPVWDFGSAFFVDYYPEKHFWEDSFHHNHWAAQLYQFPALQKRMGELWREYYQTKFNTLFPFAQDFLTDIQSAAASDKQRWPQYGNENLNDKFEYLKRFLNGAQNYLNRIFPGNGGGGEDNPSNFVVPEDEYGIYHVFFRNPARSSNWDNVKIYYWGQGLQNWHEWPGTDCEKVLIDGTNYWHYCLRASEDRDDYMLIFNNGNSGVGENQTEDLMVRKRGIYNLGMGAHAVPEEFLEVGAGTSVIKVMNDKEDKVIKSVISNGSGLSIESTKAASLSIYSIDGTCRTIELTVGLNKIELPKGIYIIEGKKYLL